MAITLHHTQRRFPLDTPQGSCTLAELIWLRGPLAGSGEARGLCLGLGRCGLCRVRFLSPPPDPCPAELRILDPGELTRGVRLACRHQAVDGMELEVEDKAAPECGKIDISRPVAMRNANSEPKDIFLAVDLGTSSLAWQAGDRQGHMPNPQLSAGSEIMSRLALAAEPENARRLRDLVRNCLRGLVRDLEEDNGTVRLLGLAANPAMTALALGLDCGGLRAAPYRLDYPGGRLEQVPDLPPVWTAPQISPFLGGDLGAGLATLLDSPRPFLLADMGTNGEFLLLDRPGRQDKADRLLAASVPLGPALEGVGMSCGGLAGPGVVTHFRLGPQGLQGETPGGIVPQRISGTGYLSLLAILLDLGLIGPQGAFIAKDPGTPPHLAGLRATLARRLRRAPDSGEPRLELGHGLYLSAGDVENLLKVKAAFSLAVTALLRRAGLRPEDLDRLYLAGALGRHAPLPALERLGFLPPAAVPRTVAVGNTALTGMALLLRAVARDMGLDEGSPDGSMLDGLRKRLDKILETCEVLDLTADPAFYQEYVNAMEFPPV